MERIRWKADFLNIVDEPMAASLIKYRMRKDRHPDPDGNLVSSHLYGSKLHAPIIDLDFPHEYVRSSTDLHGHLYINVPMSRIRMFVMLAALRIAGVIEPGFFWWSLRRGATFVRPPGVEKTEWETTHYTYGMFFKLRRKRRDDTG